MLNNYFRIKQQREEKSILQKSLRFLSLFIGINLSVEGASSTELIQEETTSKQTIVEQSPEAGLAQQEEVVSLPRELSIIQELNPDEPFERVITLGHWCTTKGAINYYFTSNDEKYRTLNINERMIKTKKGHADLFDWLFINDYSKLADAFNNNLDDFFEKSDFDWNKLVNTKYSMHWNHLFDSKHYTQYFSTDQNIDGFEFPEGFIKSKIDEFFPVIKEKMNYLRKKFIESKKHKTLHVISDPRENNIEEHTLRKLFSSLVKIRENNNFLLLYFPSKINIKYPENINNTKIIELEKPSGAWDKINHNRWKEILDEFKFTPNIWE